MKNLEQIRAENALRCSRESNKIRGKQGGEVIKKVPPLIMNHGLLAAAAFAFGDNEGHREAWDWIAKHLADPRIAILPESNNSCEKLLEYLTGADADSALLSRATRESMAWLSYARRFVREQKTEGSRA